MSIRATRVGRLDKPVGHHCGRCGIEVKSPRKTSIRPLCADCYMVERRERKGVVAA